MENPYKNFNDIIEKGQSYLHIFIPPITMYCFLILYHIFHEKSTITRICNTIGIIAVPV